jgi:outer membrane protein TolC
MSRYHRFFRILGLGFSLGAAGMASSAAFGQTSALTLEQALARAEEANISLKLSRETAQQALGLAQQQRVSLLPNVSLNAQQKRSESVALTDKVPVQGATVNRYDGKLVGSLEVLNPQSWSIYQSARKGVQVAQLDVASMQQSALSSVSIAYFTHLRNLRRLDVLDANVQRAQTLLTLSQNQASAGVATKIDVTRAESQLAQANLARMQHSTTLVSSELSIERLLELPTDIPIRLQVVSLRKEKTAELNSETLRRLRDRRPDYQRALAAVEQAKMDVRSARWQRLPSVALNGEYGKVSAKVGNSGEKDAWLASAAVSLPIFDGLKSSADHRVALSRQRVQELRLQQLSTQIDAELRLARQDSDSRSAQIAVAETSLRLAREELQLARARFEQGVADNREVVEAQNQLAVAEDGLVEAEYMYNLARVELARAQGDIKAVLSEIDR